MQLRGYDFHLLESFQGHVHSTCENMGLDVKDSWASPCQTLEVSTYELGGTSVRDTFYLSLYERNVQLSNLRSVDAPLLLDVLRASLPEGVMLSVHPHEEEHYEARYIPDPFVEGLKSELREIEEKKEEQREEAAVKKEAREIKKKQSLLATLDDLDDDDYD